MCITQQVVRLPHTCYLPEDFSKLPSEEQASFIEDYFALSQVEYDLRQRVAQGDHNAWQQYQRQMNQAVRLYVQQANDLFTPYIEQILHNLWETITPERAPLFWGDAMTDIVNATISLSLLIVISPA